MHWIGERNIDIRKHDVVGIDLNQAPALRERVAGYQRICVKNDIRVRRAVEPERPTEDQGLIGVDIVIARVQVKMV